jgi:hypothetical protein
MALIDLPRWLYKWILGLFMNKPAKFIAMRYYDVKNLFEKRKEKKAEAKKSRKERVRTKRSSGKTQGRRT